MRIVLRKIYTNPNQTTIQWLDYNNTEDIKNKMKPKTRYTSANG